jgi:hypothetical protein
MHIDNTQGNIRSSNPYYFTNIFAIKFSTQTHFAIISNVNARKWILEMNKSTTQGDILDNGWIKRIFQVKLTAIFAIKPYVKPLFCHYIPRYQKKHRYVFTIKLNYSNVKDKTGREPMQGTRLT